MSSSPKHTVQTGTVGGTPIVPDLLSPGAATWPWDIKKVTLSSNYVRASPAGFPELPPAGTMVKGHAVASSTLLSGTTYSFFAHEAAALVAAGAGSYA
jgi:hypothetical protein